IISRRAATASGSPTHVSPFGAVYSAFSSMTSSLVVLLISYSLVFARRGSQPRRAFCLFRGGSLKGMGSHAEEFDRQNHRDQHQPDLEREEQDFQRARLHCVGATVGRLNGKTSVGGRAGHTIVIEDVGR